MCSATPLHGNIDYFTDKDVSVVPIDTSGQQAELGERFAIPEDAAHGPSMTASHDASSEPTYHFRAEPLPGPGEQEPLATEEELPARPEMDQKVGEAAGGKDFPGTGFGETTCLRE